MLTKKERLKAIFLERPISYVSPLHGQIIRNERKKLNLTLEEAARGICSVSYLCKVEKNAIIADEVYLRAIFERINLDYNLVGANIIDNYATIILRAYLYGNYKGIYDLYNKIEDTIYNPSNHLIRAIYFLVKDEYDEFSESIKVLDGIKESLSKIDLGILILLVSEYYIKTYQFKDAYNNMTLYLVPDFPLEELNLLMLEQHLKVGYTLNKPQLMMFASELINNISSVVYPSFKRLTNYLMVLSFTASEYRREVRNTLKNYDFDNNDYFSNDEVAYWYLIAKCKVNDCLDVFDYILEKQLYTDVNMLGVLVYAADNINDDNYLKYALTLAGEFDFSDKDSIHQKFIKFIDIKNNGEKKHLVVDYLKSNLLPYKDMYIHHLYSTVYKDFYLNYLKSVSKYKEALNLVL